MYSRNMYDVQEIVLWRHMTILFCDVMCDRHVKILFWRRDVNLMWFLHSYWHVRPLDVYLHTNYH